MVAKGSVLHERGQFRILLTLFLRCFCSRRRLLLENLAHQRRWLPNTSGITTKIERIWA